MYLQRRYTTEKCNSIQIHTSTLQAHCAHLHTFADMAENAVYDAIAQSGVENDDEHGADEEIVVAADDNVLDQVS